MMTLYHWSPTERRPAILSEGLRRRSQPTASTKVVDYISFGTTPRGAFVGLGLLDGEWDLWEVNIPDGLHIAPYPYWSGSRQEVRVHSDIDPAYCWYIATRRFERVLRDRLS